MTDLEQLLADRLETRADRVLVGPAPVDAMVRAAVVRRRRPYVALAGAAAVAVVAGGLAVLLPAASTDPAPPDPPVAPAPTPETRLIGSGPVVVEVPAGLTDRVASVRVLTGSDRRDVFPTIDFQPDAITIDGTAATRSPTFCRRGRCTVAVEIPTLLTQVVVRSQGGRVLADELVAGIRVRPELGVTKRIGIGHLSVEVPTSWSRDVSRCGTALEDTLLTYGSYRECRIDQPAGVESVRIVTEDPFGPDEPLVEQVEIDGVAARRGAVVCDLPAVPQCSARLWLPSEGVGLVVSSTTGAEAVSALLGTAVLDRALVALPVPHRLGDGVPLVVGRYAERLEEAGLRVDLTKVGEGTDVLTVTPEPGTVVPVGSRVRVEFGASS